MGNEQGPTDRRAFSPVVVRETQRGRFLVVNGGWYQGRPIVTCGREFSSLRLFVLDVLIQRRVGRRVTPILFAESERRDR